MKRTEWKSQQQFKKWNAQFCASHSILEMGNDAFWTAWAIDYDSKRAEHIAAALQVAGNSLTVEYGGFQFTAYRKIDEHIAGKPVFGVWCLRSEDSWGSDAPATEQEFGCFSELIAAMRQARPHNLTDWKFSDPEFGWCY